MNLLVVWDLHSLYTPLLSAFRHFVYSAERRGFFYALGLFFLLCSSYAPPLCLLTKLDDNTIKIPLSIRVSSSLVMRIIGGTREEDARHFLGKMKKMPFSLEKKEKILCLFFLRRYSIVTPSLLHRKSIVSMEERWRTDGLSMEYQWTFKGNLTLLFTNYMACRYNP